MLSETGSGDSLAVNVLVDLVRKISAQINYELIGFV